MATNPRIPDRHDVPTLQEQRREKKPGSPWVPLGLLAAALLLIALIIWLPRAPKQNIAPAGATVPPQPTGNQVQLTDIRLSPSPAGDQLYIYGRMLNHGTTSINGVRARVTFTGNNGQPVGTVTAPVEAVDNGVGRNLVQQPIPRNQAADFRIDIEHTPQGWNRQLPEIAIDQVTAVGSR